MRPMQQQGETVAQQDARELQAPPVSTPPSSATNSGDRPQRCLRLPACNSADHILLLFYAAGNGI